MTALTLNGNQDVSGTLSTADQLVSTQAGTTSSGQTTKVGLLTGWGEIFAQGSIATWPALGAIGSPSGNGWLFDVTTLEAQTIIAGNWQWTEKSRITAGTATVDMVVRFYKRSSGGVYTLIVSITLGAQSFTSTTTVYTSASTAASSMAFVTGDKLYKDIWYNCTANSGAGSGTNFAVQTCNNVASGLSGVAQVTTPGYQPTASGIQLRIGDGYGGC